MNQKLKRAIEHLREGKFLLIHDGDSRENEVDLVLLAEKVRAQHIATMRRDAGGLICLALDYKIAQALGLPYIRDVFQIASKNYPVLELLSNSPNPYGDYSSFSISLNHKLTYTGITDKDRALTIKELANLASRALRGEEVYSEFVRNFRSPGHVSILISSRDFQRKGHTELSIYLANLANLTPAMVICEMLDSKTKLSLKVEKAKEYAKERGLVYLEAEDILKQGG